MTAEAIAVESSEATTITEYEAEQVERANATGRTPVVFVHGLWLLPSSWDRWAAVFEEAGYTALTPGWPDDPETVEEANEHPEVFAHKTIGQVADHFEEIIRGLDRKPAVIGHSFGGLLTQILAGRGCAAVSVAIDPAPFRGVLPLPISALKSAFPVLHNPANRNRAVPLTYEQFRFGFANAVGEDEAKELYNTYAVPAPGAPLFQAATANLNPWTEAKVRSKSPERGPLLIVSGEKDNTVPWAIANASYKRQKRNEGVTEIVEIAGPRPRAHDRQRLARGRRHGARVRPPLRPGGMSVCAHLDSIAVTELPETIAGCEECLKIGSPWVHLRMCMTCGKIGCCDSSPNRHASRHAAEVGHPIARSAEPGEDWSWCFVDEIAFVVSPGGAS